MIVHQEVKVKWHGMTRKHYESLGYEYTKKDEEFFVLASELSPGSNIKIRFICDYCGKEGVKRNDTLIKQRKFINKDSCEECAHIKHNEVLIQRNGSLESKYPEVASEWCEVSNGISASIITPYSGKRGKWRCKRGHEWTAPVYSRTGSIGTSCPICNESRGERRIAEILDSFKVNYIREVSISDLKGLKGGSLRFDFALKDSNGYINSIIEYDGPFHFGRVFKGDNHARTVKNDKIKNKYCEDNNLTLYRIHYKDYDNLWDIINNICKEESLISI